VPSFIEIARLSTEISRLAEGARCPLTLIPRGAWSKRRQTKSAKVKTATRNGYTVRGLQALISCIDCETIDV